MIKTVLGILCICILIGCLGYTIGKIIEYSIERYKNTHNVPIVGETYLYTYNKDPFREKKYAKVLEVKDGYVKYEVSYEGLFGQTNRTESDSIEYFNLMCTK